MKYKIENIGRLEEVKRIIQWLVFNQSNRNNYVILFENFESIFINSALKDEFGIDCLDSYGPQGDIAIEKKCVGFLISEEDANLLRLMRPEKLVLCVDVGTVIDFYNKVV